MNHDQVVVLREGHDLLEELQLHHGRRRVVGEAQDQELGLRPGFTEGRHQVFEEILPRREAHVPHVPAGDDHGIGVDRVRRIGNQGDVTGFHDGQGQVRQPLLRADGGDGLGVGVQQDTVTPAVPVADRVPKLGDAPRCGVPVVARVARRLAQLLHDVGGRGQVRVAHAEVDDVLAPRPRLDLQLVHDGEDVGRQPLDPFELFHAPLYSERRSIVRSPSPARLPTGGRE